MVFLVVSILSIYTQVKYQHLSPAWILLIISIIGIFAGQSIRMGIYSWIRSLIIVLSLLLSTILILVPLIGISEINKINSENNIEHSLPNKEVQQLFKAVYLSDIELLSKQLEKGVDVNSFNETQQTALHLTQDKEFARILIQHGANVNAKNDVGQTPIFNKELVLITTLLNADADINARSSSGNTPFLWFAYSGYLEGIKLLISRGANINACNNDQHNALYLAEHFHYDSEMLSYLQTLAISDCK